jgi:hypothetical protein
MTRVVGGTEESSCSHSEMLVISVMDDILLVDGCVRVSI